MLSLQQYQRRYYDSRLSVRRVRSFVRTDIVTTISQKGQERRGMEREEGKGKEREWGREKPQ